MKRCLPGVKPIGQWGSANRGFYGDFLRWLREGGCGRRSDGTGGNMECYAGAPAAAFP